ncbi:MAG TPA: glycosyltransferase [Acetobacteraceae bacterium]|nr:glycosyltransferase [Acetobacteraceae bacterium]
MPAALSAGTYGRMRSALSAPLTLPHRLWRLLPAGGRRRLFAETTALLAPRPDRIVPLSGPGHAEGLVIAGELSRSSGLGEGARLMLKALGHLGVAAWPLDITGPMWPGAASDLPPLTPAAPPAGAGLVLTVNPPMLPWVLLHQKRHLLRRRRVIGYWSWELESVPATWRVGPRFVHEVWVPSRFTARAIEPLLPGQVRVVPHPLAIAPPAPARRDRQSFGLPAGAVIVLVSFSISSSYVRKNPLAAVAAFQAAFGNRPDRFLLMKVGNPSSAPEDFQELSSAVSNLANVRLFTETLSPADNHALIATADIVLSLHRSEGFGLVLAEAMLLGKPVVATGWSGNLDFMDEASAALVGYHLIPASDPRGVFEAPGAVWAEPDIGEAARHLVRLADDPAARASLGARARAMALARLGTAPLESALAGIGLGARR